MNALAMGMKRVRLEKRQSMGLRVHGVHTWLATILVVSRYKRRREVTTSADLNTLALWKENRGL